MTSTLSNAMAMRHLLAVMDELFTKHSTLADCCMMQSALLNTSAECNARKGFLSNARAMQGQCKGYLSDVRAV